MLQYCYSKAVLKYLQVCGCGGVQNLENFGMEIVSKEFKEDFENKKFWNHEFVLPGKIWKYSL